MNEKMAPRTPLLFSDEQDAGLYTTAHGETVPNRGKKVLHVVTLEGHTWAMKVQITDVNRALKSVTRTQSSLRRMAVP